MSSESVFSGSTTWIWDSHDSETSTGSSGTTDSWMSSESVFSGSTTSVEGSHDSEIIAGIGSKIVCSNSTDSVAISSVTTFSLNSDVSTWSCSDCEDSGSVSGFSGSTVSAEMSRTGWIFLDFLDLGFLDATSDSESLDEEELDEELDDPASFDFIFLAFLDLEILIGSSLDVVSAVGCSDSDWSPDFWADDFCFFVIFFDVTAVATDSTVLSASDCTAVSIVWSGESFSGSVNCRRGSELLDFLDSDFLLDFNGLLPQSTVSPSNSGNISSSIFEGAASTWVVSASVWPSVRRSNADSSTSWRVSNVSRHGLDDDSTSEISTCWVDGETSIGIHSSTSWISTLSPLSGVEGAAVSSVTSVISTDPLGIRLVWQSSKGSSTIPKGEGTWLMTFLRGLVAIDWLGGACSSSTSSSTEISLPFCRMVLRIIKIFLDVVTVIAGKSLLSSLSDVFATTLDSTAITIAGSSLPSSGCSVATISDVDCSSGIFVVDITVGSLASGCSFSSSGWVMTISGSRTCSSVFGRFDWSWVSFIEGTRLEARDNWRSFSSSSTRHSCNAN